MICVMMACGLSMSAQELVYPPEGLPEESWTMEYNDYTDIRRLKHDYPRNLKRDVTFVWNRDTLYVKGIIEEFPDSWVKAGVKNNNITFDKLQTIGNKEVTVPVYDDGILVSTTVEDKTVYFLSGVSECTESISRDYYVARILFYWANPESQYPRVLTYTLSDDGNTISSSVTTTPHRYYYPLVSAFWTNFIDYGYYYITRRWDRVDEYRWPDEDCPINIRFVKNR